MARRIAAGMSRVDGLAVLLHHFTNVFSSTTKRSYGWDIVLICRFEQVGEYVSFSQCGLKRARVSQHALGMSEVPPQACLTCVLGRGTPHAQYGRERFPCFT